MGDVPPRFPLDVQQKAHRSQTRVNLDTHVLLPQKHRVPQTRSGKRAPPAQPCGNRSLRPAPEPGILLTLRAQTLPGSFQVPSLGFLLSQVLGLPLQSQLALWFQAARSLSLSLTSPNSTGLPGEPGSQCSFQNPSAEASCACKQCCCVTHMQFPAMLCNGRWQERKGEPSQQGGRQSRSAAESGGGRAGLADWQKGMHPTPQTTAIGQAGQALPTGADFREQHSKLCTQLTLCSSFPPLQFVLVSTQLKPTMTFFLTSISQVSVPQHNKRCRHRFISCNLESSLLYL